MYLAVVDTNVLVSALLSKKPDVATIKVFRKMLDGTISPVYNSKILEEYEEVLHREKFHFEEKTIQVVFTAIKQFGMEVTPEETTEKMIDEDDRIFYDTALSVQGAFLITGNTKHYPDLSFIVTPVQMLEILEKEKSHN